MTKKKLAIILLLGVMALLLSLWHTGAFDVIRAIPLGDSSAAAGLLAKAGPAAVLISILLNVLISVLGVVPSVFLTGANIMVFGLWGGFFVSWAGEIAGAVVSFLLYRWGVKSVAKIPTEHWKLFRTVNSLPGLRQVYFLTILRMAPFVPSGIINLVGAMTTVSLTHFVIATTLGKFPALLLETAFSYNVITLGKNYIYLIISIIVAGLLYFGVKKELQRFGQHQ